MSEQSPTVVLLHGAFAESASWSAVVEQLQSRGIDVVAAANPLRSVAGDAAYVRDVISGIGAPVVLVGHSYGGMVITEAAAHNDAVVGLVYVARSRPTTGSRRSSSRPCSPAARSAMRSSPIRCRPAATSSRSGKTCSTSSSRRT